MSGGGAIRLDSASGSIQTEDIIATGVNGGEIRLNAAENISTGNLDSEGLGGTGGNITTMAGGQTEILSLDGRGTAGGEAFP